MANTLKKKILETEEKLLMNGIDTSEYSLFLKEEQDSDLDIKNVEDVKFEVESDIDTDN